MLQFFLFCVATTLAGRSLLRRLGLAQDPGQGVLLGPAAALVAVTLALCLGVSLGLPTRSLCLALWVAVLLAAADGCRGPGRRTLGQAAWLLLPLILALMVLGPYVLHGMTDSGGSWFGDKWFYIARGQYFWDQPGPETIAASPLYRMGTFYPFRYASGALLAFFSAWASPQGQAASAVGPYLGWLVFVYAAAGLAFARAGRLFEKPVWALAAGLVTVLSGWTVSALVANNFDNLLALPLLPAAGAFLAQADPARRSHGLAFGALCAVAVYVFFESAPLLLLGCGLFLAGAALARGPWRAWLGFAAWAGLAFALLLLPAGPDMGRMVRIQADALLRAGLARPGSGYFPGLLQPLLFAPTYLGWLGPLQPAPKVLWPLALGGAAVLAALAAAALAGARQLWRHRLFGPLAFWGLLLLAQLAALAVWGYDYGAYKCILLGWWLFGLCAVAGLASFARGAAWRGPAAGLVVALLAGAAVWRVVDFDRRNPERDLSGLRLLHQASTAAGDRPVVVSLADPAGAPWAAYGLRRNRLILFGWEHQLFSAHLTGDADPKQGFGQADFVLTDTPEAVPGRIPAWSGGGYFLFPLSHPRVLLDKVVNKNGEDRPGGRAWYWLGDGDTVLDVYADYDGQARLAARIEPGPGVADPGASRLTVSNDGAGAVTLAVPEKRQLSVVVPVHPGKNRIILTPTAVTDPSRQPPGDSRPLLFGLSGLVVQAVKE